MLNNTQQLLFHKQYGVNATIHLERLRRNIKIVQSHIPSSCRIIATIKADAYGHGAIEIAKELERNQIELFAVLDLDEAISLRYGKINSSILILSDVPKEFVGEIVAHNLTVSASSIDFVEALSFEAKRQGRKTGIHIKVDTGMGRFGLPPDQVIDFINSVRRFSSIQVEGIFSHLSSTFLDDVESDTYTIKQIESFNALLAQLEEMKLLPGFVHLGSSTSLIGFPDKVVGGYYNSIRIGTLLLGFEERKSDWQEHPTPICELQTKILTLKKIYQGAYISYDRLYRAPTDLLVGILPVGYAHGLHRDLGNRGAIVVNNARAPIIGKITLGNTMVNLTDVDAVTEAMPVGLVGEFNSAFEQGKKINRGTWEILLPLLQRCNSKNYIP